MRPLREFFLSEDLGNVEIEHDADRGGWRWTPIVQQDTQFPALNVMVGEAALTPTLEFGPDIYCRCHMVVRDETLGTEGVRAQLFFRPAEGGEELTLFEMPLRRSEQTEASVTFDLSPLKGRQGRLGLRCRPAAPSDAAEGRIAVLRWLAGREDRLGLLNGRANRATRIKNELAHFEAVYEHPIYADRKEVDDPDPDAGRSVVTSAWEMSADDLLERPSARVRRGEDVYHYSYRILLELLGDAAFVDFAGRLKLLAEKGRPLRLLSLCSGAAGVERALLAEAHVPIEVTLFDINEHLMEQAVATLTPFGPVRGIVGDVNDLSSTQFEGQFDVVACVSGLHHVVELEAVVRTVFNLLTDDGEFWLVGEQVGRDGNRLWPEGAEVANRLFSKLPEDLRRNAHTGRIDRVISDIDFSGNTFEGIRSSEIERVLEELFEPVEVSRHNCFMWRMLENTYFANYDLSDDTHRRIVLELVAAEYNLWRKGGRATQCYGVYQPRRTLGDMPADLDFGDGLGLPKKPSLVIVGDAQAETIALFLRLVPAVRERFEVSYQSSTAGLLSGTGAEPDKSIVLCAQVEAAEPSVLGEDSPAIAQRIRFPRITFDALWPFHTFNPFDRKEPPDFPHGRFPYGDSFVAACVESGVPPREILPACVSYEWNASWPDLDALLAAESARLREDRAIEVEIGSYILERFRDERLFWAVDAPTNALLIELAARLVDVILERPPPREEMQNIFAEVSRQEVFGAISVPIHRYVAKHFALAWYRVGEPYNHFGDPLSYTEYFEGLIEHSYAVKNDRARRSA
jgi:SAM-dependent methyltransferase